MRLLILRDKSLNTTEFNKSVGELKALYQGVGITMTITQEEYYWGDPSVKPRPEMWEEYWGGYYGMKFGLLNGIVSEIRTRYGKKFDHILIAMDARNWYGDTPQDKVWGWNISAGLQGLDVQQCRVDTVSRNETTRIANTVGTIYHELMHSHKHFPYRVRNGIVIERNLNTQGFPTNDWGNGVVHGSEAPWEYIRHKENIKALEVVAPVLSACYKIKKLQDERGMTWSEAISESFRTAVIKATQPMAEACIYTQRS
jgi:hypothetical protein